MSKFICTLHVYYKVLLFKFNLVMRRILCRGKLNFECECCICITCQKFLIRIRKIEFSQHRPKFVQLEILRPLHCNLKIIGRLFKTGINYPVPNAHTVFEFQRRAHSVRPVHISSLISRFEVVESDLTAHAPPFLFFSKRFQKNSCPTFFYVVWHWPFRRAVVCRVYLENKYNYILKVVATFRVGLSRIKYCVELLYLYKVTTARWAASEFSLLIVTNLISQRPMTN